MRKLLLIAIAAVAAAQQQPNLAAQREAMKKLEFLAGKWSGDATVVRGPGTPLKITQTEDVYYKLDGLVMVIEGTGRTADGKVVFQAFATVAYDDATSTYRFRAYNDGRYLDTDLEVTPGTFAWGFTAGPAKVRNVMRLSAKGEWTETTEFTLGDNPPRRTVDMTLSRVK